MFVSSRFIVCLLGLCFTASCQEAQPLAPLSISAVPWASLATAARVNMRGGHHGGPTGATTFAFQPAKQTALAYLKAAASANQPLICGHRGADGYAPENTLSSFMLAQSQHAQLFECDVRRTKDNEIIVVHDDDLKRTTHGQGDWHDHAYFGDLDHLDAGAWFSSAFKGANVPTLRQVLLWAKDRPILPLIHLKEPGIAADVAAVFKEMGVQDKVAVHADLLDELDAFAAASPETPTFPLWFDKPAAPPVDQQLAYLKAHHHAGVAMPWATVAPERVQALQAAGYLVEVFTLDRQPGHIITALGKQANILTADYPDLVVAAVNAL